MKKVISLLMKSLFVFAAIITFGQFKAEAANIAVLPVENYINHEGIEGVYYDRILEVVNGQGTHELVDDEKIDAALKKGQNKIEKLDKASLIEIADNTNADVVFGMTLEKLVEQRIQTGSEEWIEMTLQGKVVSYDRETGKFVNRKIYDRHKVLETLTVRSDYQLQYIANQITREIKKTLGVKKVTIEKPRISKAGFKGDRR